MQHEVNFEVIESLDEFFYSEKFISLAVGTGRFDQNDRWYHENRAPCGSKWPNVRTVYAVLGAFGYVIRENSSEIRRFQTS